MKTSIVLNTIFALASAACATAAPPADLVAARTSYDRAQHGPAAELDPADLYTAKQAMDAAEQAYARDGDTQETIDLAYVADRRAQIAEARANAAQSNKNQQQTIADMHAEQAAQMRATSAQLDRANQQLAVQSQAMQNQAQQLVNEREARTTADKRAALANADLAKFASVKQESRGTVITLSGGVLFASGSSALLAAAELKLDNVAQALSQQDPESKLVVEGHTDSQGGPSYNQQLSERRAQTVRDYLVSRGVAADRVTSRGFGSSRPVANNNSPEGRANNRRVEIVVEPAAAATSAAR